MGSIPIRVILDSDEDKHHTLLVARVADAVAVGPETKPLDYSRRAEFNSQATASDSGLKKSDEICHDIDSNAYHDSVHGVVV